MIRILCTSHDKDLLRARKLVLEQEGYASAIATSEEAVRQAIASDSFDIAVIGHTVTPQEKLRTFALIRERIPAIKVLEIYGRGTGKILEGADDYLDIAAETKDELLNHIALLIKVAK